MTNRDILMLYVLPISAIIFAVIAVSVGIYFTYKRKENPIPRRQSADQSDMPKRRFFPGPAQDQKGRHKEQQTHAQQHPPQGAPGIGKGKSQCGSQAKEQGPEDIKQSIAQIFHSKASRRSLVHCTSERVGWQGEKSTGQRWIPLV